MICLHLSISPGAPIRLFAMFVLLTIPFIKGCSTEPENRPPVAVFSVNPESGDPETVFSFDAVGSSDPDEESRFLQVRWDWESDGVWDTIWSANKTRSHTFGSVGRFPVAMEIRDSWGATAATSFEIVTGTPPSAAFTCTPVIGSIDPLIRTRRGALAESICRFEEPGPALIRHHGEVSRRSPVRHQQPFFIRQFAVLSPDSR